MNESTPEPFDTRSAILVCARVLREYYVRTGHEDWAVGLDHHSRIAYTACNLRYALEAHELPSKRMLLLLEAEKAYGVADALAAVEDQRNGLPHLRSPTDVAVASALAVARSTVADAIRALELPTRGSKPRTSRPTR